MTEKPMVADAPGLAWRRRADGWVAIWIARKKNFRPATQRLWSGAWPSENDVREISEQCQRLQAEMRGAGLPKPRSIDRVTDLMRLYQTHEMTPYHGLRFITRKDYDWRISKINSSVGSKLLANMSGEDFLRWYANWRKPKSEGLPERIRRAHGLITMVRIVFKFCATLKLQPDVKKIIRELKSDLNDLEFENQPARTSILEAWMADAVRARAHQDSVHSIALAQAFQFELTLRQKDIIGEWVPVAEPGLSEVTDRDQKWLRGLRWEEIDENLILKHQTSKRGQVLSFDLKLYPMVVEELLRIPADRRKGPVIISEATGQPYRKRHFADIWRGIADLAKIPAGVWNMDSRAGGVTEATDADSSDENLEAVRAHSGHNDIGTTQRYSRGTLKKTSKVAVLRAESRKIKP